MRCSSQEDERLTRTDSMCVHLIYWSYMAQFFGKFLVCSGVCSISLVVSCVPTICLSKLLGPSTMWMVPPAQTVLLLGDALYGLTVRLPGRFRNEAKHNTS